MILDIEQTYELLKISYYDKKGNVAFKKYDTNNLYNWVLCGESDPRKDPVYKNWDGRAVKKAKCKFQTKYSMLEFLQNLPTEDKEDLFALNFPKTYFFDIETEVLDGFPDPEFAKNKITAISITSPDYNVITLATKQLEYKEITKIQEDINEYIKSTGKRFNFTFKYFESETDMLFTFLDKFVKNIPLLSGWNIVNFDWKYIINRCKHLALDPIIASPVHQLRYDNIPLHVGILDYMEIYKKWDRSVEIKENFTLDSNAEAVLKLKKIKYNGTLQDLYNKDYEKYILYNAIDTILVQLMHEKLKTLDIALTLANLCNISIYKASSPVTVTESLFCRKFLEKNLVMTVDPSKQGITPKKQQFTGAYVKKPVPGLYKLIMCNDYSSLYPSCMRQLNISPESFIEKLYGIVKPKDENDEYTRAQNKKIIDARKTDDVIISTNGCVFQKEDSILKQILNELYSNRKKNKKLSFHYELEADYIKHLIESKKQSYAV